MLINEINKMLDKQCVLSFSLEHPLTQLSETYGLTAIIKIRMHGEGGVMIVNMPYKESYDKDIVSTLKGYDAIIEGDALSARIDISNLPFIHSFRNLINIPSVVIDGVILDKGMFYLYFRYHHNNHRHVSKLLLSEGGSYTDFAVRYLGESQGILSAIQEIDKQIPLYYVEISSRVPSKSIDIMRDHVLITFGISWDREVKYVIEDEIHAVYYDQNAVLKKGNEWATEISPSERIYETTFYNPVIEYYIKESSKSSIVTLGMPQKLFGNRFSFSAIIPSMHLTQFFPVIFRSFEKFPEWEMVMDNVSEVSEIKP